MELVISTCSTATLGRQGWWLKYAPLPIYGDKIRRLRSAPLLLREIRSAILNLLHYNFREINLYLEPAPLQLQGDKVGDLNLLHCRYMEIRFVILDPLHYCLGR
ncbi:hypothetical protein CXB51_022261 [Gossypium anomalum]|uniref:Uncharacterized protein n=1 Tax=Gossypium anomalum TaxID=47600 RepID=A0A8J5YJV8_9ROSI|nr:hypothetical protein CXB51_022261 [Gossypium anomalum]